MVTEKEFYEPIRKILLNNFKTAFDDCRLWVTSEGSFPEEIKTHFHKGDEIIFSFLKKKNSPDLTGYVKLIAKAEPESSPLREWFNEDVAAYHFITVEIKNTRIELADIYQAKRYADLFKAKFGLLISTKPIPTEIIRLCETIPILVTARKEKMRIGQFDPERDTTIWNSCWFPSSPFQRDEDPKLF